MSEAPERIWVWGWRGSGGQAGKRQEDGNMTDQEPRPEGQLTRAEKSKLIDEAVEHLPEHLTRKELVALLLTMADAYSADGRTMLETLVTTMVVSARTLHMTDEECAVMVARCLRSLPAIPKPDKAH